MSEKPQRGCYPGIVRQSLRKHHQQDMPCITDFHPHCLVDESPCLQRPVRSTWRPWERNANGRVLGQVGEAIFRDLSQF
jgi:hypothetical protein